MFQCFPELIDEFITLEGTAVIEKWLDSNNEKISFEAKLLYDKYLLGTQFNDFLFSSHYQSWGANGGVFGVEDYSETYNQG